MTDELKEQAEVVAAEHNPDNDENVGCAVCGYSRHPCDAYDLAAATLAHLTKPAYVWLGLSVPAYEMGEIYGVFATSAAAKAAVQASASEIDNNWKVTGFVALVAPVVADRDTETFELAPVAADRDPETFEPAEWTHRNDHDLEVRRYEIEGPGDV